MKKVVFEEDFKERFRKLLLTFNMKQIEVAEKTGIERSVINNYYSGRCKPKLENLNLIAKVFGVDPVWLMGGNVEMYIPKEEKIEVTAIPVVGKITAGEPILAVENIEERIMIPTNMYHADNLEECFFLKVKGESMNKIVQNGAYVLVQKQDTAETGDIVVAIVNDLEEATLKRFKQLDTYMIMLEPVSTYEEFIPRIIDLHENKDFKIVGKVIGDYRKW